MKAWAPTAICTAKRRTWVIVWKARRQKYGHTLVCVVCIMLFYYLTFCLNKPVGKGETTSICAKRHRATLRQSCPRVSQEGCAIQQASLKTDHPSQSLWDECQGQVTATQETCWKEQLRFSLPPHILPWDIQVHCATIFDKAERPGTPRLPQAPVGDSDPLPLTASALAANPKLTMVAGHEHFQGLFCK